MSADNAPRFNMTVGIAPKKFVWFRVAKCGTRSTLSLLRTHVSEFEIENGYGDRYKPRKYAEYYKFAFVRDPYTRIVSAWKNKIVDGAPGGGKLESGLLEKLKDFDYFLDWLSEQDPRTVNIHYRPQALLVPKAIDFIGRLERFERDYSYVLGQIGITDYCKIPHHNRTDKNKDEILNSKRVTARISQLYAVDFKRFDYPVRFE